MYTPHPFNFQRLKSKNQEQLSCFLVGGIKKTLKSRCQTPTVVSLPNSKDQNTPKYLKSSVNVRQNLHSVTSSNSRMSFPQWNPKQSITSLPFRLRTTPKLLKSYDLVKSQAYEPKKYPGFFKQKHPQNENNFIYSTPPNKNLPSNLSLPAAATLN